MRIATLANPAGHQSPTQDLTTTFSFWNSYFCIQLCSLFCMFVFKSNKIRLVTWTLPTLFIWYKNFEKLGQLNPIGRSSLARSRSLNLISLHLSLVVRLQWDIIRLMILQFLLHVLSPFVLQDSHINAARTFWPTKRLVQAENWSFVCFVISSILRRGPERLLNVESDCWRGNNLPTFSEEKNNRQTWCGTRLEASSCGRFVF